MINFLKKLVEQFRKASSGGYKRMENCIILKNMIMKCEVCTLVHEPSIIGEPYYYITLEKSKSKETIDISISKEDFIRLTDFMIGKRSGSEEV